MEIGQVSCVIPVFNMELYVAAAIRSVLEQVSPPLEILVVDDGSSDATAREVARFGDQIAHLHQPHAGVSAARNAGVRSARGEFVCFLDADDLYRANKLRDQLAAFAEKPNLQFCDAHSRYFWSEEMDESQRAADPRYAHPFWEKSAPGHISTWLVRRAVFDRIGLFDEGLQFSEDSDWLLRCRDAGLSSRTLPQCHGDRRLHPGNTTAGRRRQQIEALARVFRRSRERRQGQGVDGIAAH
jgi:glycosyltransferase involved in cell wall biosynthesis